MGDSEMSEPSTSNGKKRRIEVKIPQNCDFISEGSYVPSDYELSSDEGKTFRVFLYVQLFFYLLLL